MHICNRFVTSGKNLILCLKLNDSEIEDMIEDELEDNGGVLGADFEDSEQHYPGYGNGLHGPYGVGGGTNARRKRLRELIEDREHRKNPILCMAESPEDFYDSCRV